jgi:hypothetical protein
MLPHNSGRRHNRNNDLLKRGCGRAVAAVRDHLKRGEAPPPIVDRMIYTTYAAIIADYRARYGETGRTQRAS